MIAHDVCNTPWKPSLFQLHLITCAGAVAEVVAGAVGAGPGPELELVELESRLRK